MKYQVSGLTLAAVLLIGGGASSDQTPGTRQ